MSGAKRHLDEPADRPRARYVDATEGDVGQRLDNFLIRELKGVPRSRVYRVIRSGEVRVNAGRARPDYRLQAGDRIRIPPVQRETQAQQPAPSRSLREFVSAAKIYEDDHLIVINKPHGVAVHGGSGLSFGIIEALRAVHPELKDLELVHRLDRETSGCLVIAKRRSVLRELHRVMREREVQKRYTALLVGKWKLGDRTIDVPLQTQHRQGGERTVRVHPAGQEARTHFKPVAGFGKVATLMDVLLDTGRTHQIRVHAAYVGHPVAGDDKYGTRELNAPLRAFGLKRMFLHARSLAFVHPGTGRPFKVEADLDQELKDVLARLSAESGQRKAGPA
jgi:23S rRNA pseudouridine955/2504/2580 synthase